LCSYSTDPRGSQLLDLEISPGEFELRNLTTYAQVRRGPVNGSVAFTAPPPGLVDIGAAEAYLRSRLARATYLPGPGH
jgi:hypothetical protein